MHGRWFDEAEVIKNHIIQKYWMSYIDLPHFNVNKVKELKDIIKGMLHVTKDLDEKREEIFNKISMYECSYAEFEQLFENCHPDLFSFIDEKEKFNISPTVPTVRKESWSLSTYEREAIKSYVDDSKFSASISIQDSSGGVFNTTRGCDEVDVPIYAMHSVGKVFTGILALSLIHHGKIPNDIFEKNVKLPEDILSALPQAVQDRIKTVTLHQLMTHQAGIGNYLEKYFETIKSSINKSSPVPNPMDPQDFLSFAEDSVSEVGKDRYSNLGFLLTGLAIEHAYKVSNPEEADINYNKLLQRFIIEPAEMKHFSISKPDSPSARFNTEDKVAPYISGSPAGGYWTSANDLRCFGCLIHKMCSEKGFLQLVRKYGQEFYYAESNTVQHNGGIKSSSAFLYVSLTDGSTHAILSDQPDTAPMLHEAIGRNISMMKAEDAIDKEPHTFPDSVMKKM